MKNRSGFTLVELLIVIIVISIIASIAIVGYSSQIKLANDKNATASLTKLTEALDEFYSQTGSYPIACGQSASPVLGCSRIPITYTASMTAPPSIPANQTATQLAAALPRLGSNFTHPRGASTAPINHTVSSIIQSNSFFLLSTDLMPSATTNGSVVFANPSGGSFECSFQLTDSNQKGVSSLQPHQYIVGYVSEEANAWKFFIQPARDDLNLVDWNTAGSSNCQAQSTDALATV